MLFSSAEIEAGIDGGGIRIVPYDVRLLRRASYTLRLGNKWRRWRSSSDPIRIWSPAASSGRLEPVEESASCVLRPGDLVLGCTAEKIAIPNDVCAFICTLSQISRFGVSTTGGSLLIRPGFGRPDPMELTLELSSSNPSPIELTAGMPLCHLVFLDLSGLASKGRESFYDNGPAAPTLYEEMSEIIGRLP